LHIRQENFRPFLPEVKPKTRDAISSLVARMLREERLRRGFSMNAVAERAGLSYQMISYVEREMRMPTLDTLLRMTEALGLNLGEVITKAERAVRGGSK
jgi:transcriptional regulator with XRE-family HTH domain